MLHKTEENASNTGPRNSRKYQVIPFAYHVTHLIFEKNKCGNTFRTTVSGQHAD